MSRFAAIAKLLRPAFFGITWGEWRRLRRIPGVRVEHPFHLRAAVTALWSLANSLSAAIERRRYAEALAAVELKPPLFVLGHWRSGTTYLHNLLAQDGRWTYPNLYQVWHPHTFLGSEAIQTRLSARMLPADRGIDQVPVRYDLPYEDEFAGWHATGLSPYMSFSWPKAAAHFDRYLTLRDLNQDEREAWQRSLLEFYRKLTLRGGGKPLLLKSPQHTARVRWLVQMFPGAKFVFVHRNPYHVYASTLRLYVHAHALAPLQHADPAAFPQRLLRQYVELHTALYEDVTLLPPGTYTEVAYADLAADPVATLARVYAALDLGGWEQAQPRVAAHAAAVATHRPEPAPELDDATIARIRAAWAPFFARWGYDMDAV